MGVVAKFATAGIAPAERLRYWNSVADEVFCGTFVNAESERFEGEMWSWRLGDLDMIRTRSVQAAVGRRPLNTHEERVIMHMQWRGQGEHRQGRQEARLGPGDFIFGSPHEPYAFNLAPHEMMVVEFPRRALVERVPDLDDLLAKPLSGSTPAARVFSDFLLSLWRQARDGEGEDTAWGEGMSRIFYDLAAMAVHEAKRVSSSHAAPELQRRALALIDTHLADPDLRSASMASELGTSVRTVQNLFAELGKTPTTAILERRLERAADRLIADPQATITQVAFAHGFNDSAYFSRCFRQKFGVSPREWRLGNSRG